MSDAPCCKWHLPDGCWYDACCGNCPELERCRARLGEARCTLPVSQHRDPRSLAVDDHEWTDSRQTHVALSEPSVSDSLRAHDRKGREGKGREDVPHPSTSVTGPREAAPTMDGGGSCQ